MKRFLLRNLNSIQNMRFGCRSKDKLSLLKIAFCESVPGRVRKRFRNLDQQLERLSGSSYPGLIVRADNLRFKIADKGCFVVICLDFEPFMEKHFSPQKGDVVLDVGANVGKYTLQAARAVGPEGCVIAVEADTNNCRALLEGIGLNDFNNVITYNVAAYDKEEQLLMYVGDTGTHSGLKADYHHGSQAVWGRTLDNIIAECKISHLDWVKVDVEGAEFEVLSGMRKSLEKFKPKLIIEVWSKNKPKVEALLTSLGYTLKEIDYNADDPIGLGSCCYYYCEPKLRGK